MSCRGRPLPIGAVFFIITPPQKKIHFYHENFVLILKTTHQEATMIETTVNLDYEIREKLDGAAMAGGISRSAMLVTLMRRVMKEYGKRARLGKAVRYQKKNPCSSRRCTHISLAERDYECFSNMRLFYKLSVSLLVSYGVERYLDEALLCLERDDDKYYTDNNIFSNYLFLCDSSYGRICWTISWGMPEKPAP